jgi:hypothetical protein
MVWQIGLIENDYKFLKTDNIGSYSTAFSSNYFIITNDGRIGINNDNPAHKLDVLGDARVNGILYTSNIIGNLSDGSNLLKINYEGVNNISTSNLLEIYGKTNMFGDLSIGNLTQINNLDVSGRIVAQNFIGVGSNITNIHTSNITSGVLPIARGGTGINVLVPNNIIYTNANFALDQDAAFTYNSSSGELTVKRIRTPEGQFIDQINANNIRSGVLGVGRGGTNKTQYDVVGGMLIGNITGTTDGATRIDQTSLLTWDNTNRNLNVIGNVRIPQASNIYIGNNILSIDTLGEYRSASFDTKGIVMLSSDFRLDAQGKVRVALTGSSKWATNAEKHIQFPFSDDVSCNYFVGIGTSPSTINNYRLDVNGDINTSNGVYKVNGVDIVRVTSNIISNRINSFNLDDIALPPPIDGLYPSSGAWNNKFFTKRLVTGAFNTFEYFISSSPESYDFVFDHPVTFKRDIKIDGAFVLSAENYTEISSIKLERNHNEAILILNQTGSGNLIDLKKASASQLIINNSGNMGIGRNLTASFDSSEAIYTEPAQKLHVIGNIISTGTLTTSYSDERLKTFTSNIGNSLDIINSLSGYHYIPNKLAENNGFTIEPDIGLSAQEVKKVLPQIVKLAPFDTVRDINGAIVSKSGENYLTICYERLGPVFVEAIKELSKENKILQEENRSIKEDMRKIKLALGIE